MTTSLYERLGGTAAVAAVVDNAVDRHATNPALASLFYGKDLPQLKALGESVFNTRGRGPCGTEGAGPALPGHGMPFSSAELQAVVDDMTEALRELGIGTVEVGEIVNLLYACEAPPLRSAAILAGTIQERGLPSLHPSGSDGGPA